MKCYKCHSELGDDNYRGQYSSIRTCPKCGELNSIRCKKRDD